MACMSGTAWTAAYSIYGALKLTPRLMRGLSGTFSSQMTLPWLPTQKVPKVVLYGELSTRHRDRGAPKKRYQDCLKKSLNVCHIDCQQWSDMAVDRDAWRHTVHKAASLFEENRRDSLKDKRQRRKAQAASTTENPDLTYMCPHCTRTCLSRIGLLSHEWACSRRGQQPS